MPQVFGLGIDTGGTNTQSVIIDMETGEIIQTGISNTTPYDLSIGIINSISNTFRQGTIKGEEVKLVSVSTTLATNSILQNKGWEVGTILIGYQPDAVKELKIDKALVKGGHDLSGDEIDFLDEDTVRKAIEVRSGRVKAFAVSGYFGCRNPEHEIRVRELIQEMTGLPVVCGHEMSPRLGMYERTTTAYLNARLLPIIKEFLDKIKMSLKERNINAPLMVVKSDGTLTSEALAREIPVETILSGPAASAIGAGVLTKLKDFIVVDIGGTSTDIGMVKDGNCIIDPEGASVGDWRTRVSALSMRTVGLAGDSRIWINNGHIWAGPERVLPLCLAAKKFPILAKKLEDTNCTDYFIAHSADNAKLEETDKEVFKAIERLQPVTFEELMRDTGKPAPLIQNSIKSFKAQYIIEGVGLTPTDLYHYQGAFVAWDVETSKKGVNTLAENLKISPEELVNRALNFAYNNVTKEIIKKLLFDEMGEESTCDTCHYILNKASSGAEDLFSFKAATKFPIVAIGGPVGLMMPPVCQRLNAKLVLPKHYEAGNAVGAISGIVMETVSVQITPKEEGVAAIFGIGEPVYLPGDQAMEFAQKEAERLALERAAKAGIEDPRVKIVVRPLGEKAQVLFYELGQDLSKEEVQSGGKQMTISCGVEVVATAIGKPTLAK